MVWTTYSSSFYWHLRSSWWTYLDWHSCLQHKTKPIHTVRNIWLCYPSLLLLLNWELFFRFRNYVGYREEPNNFVQLRYNDRPDGQYNRDGFWPQMIFNGGVYLFVEDGKAGYFWYVNLLILRFLCVCDFEAFNLYLRSKTEFTG